MHQADSTYSVSPPQAPHPFLIKLPAMILRSRRASSALSGSEYHASEKSDMNENPPEEEEEPKVEYDTTQRGRKITKKTYVESSEGEEDYDDSAANLFSMANNARVTRTSKRLRHDSEEHDAKHYPSRHHTLRSRRSHLQMEGFIEDEDDDDGEAPYGLRPRKPKPNGAPAPNGSQKRSKVQRRQPPQRSSRITRRSTRSATRAASEDFQPTSSPASADAEGSIDEGVHSSDLDIHPEPEPEPEPEEEEPDDGKPYLLRQRQPVNYAIPPPLEDLSIPPQAAKRPGPHGRSGRSGYGGAGAAKRKGPGWSATGAELGRWMGMPADDSVSPFLRNVLFIGSISSILGL